MESRIHEIQKWLSLDDETIENWKVGLYNTCQYIGSTVFQDIQVVHYECGFHLLCRILQTSFYAGHCTSLKPTLRGITSLTSTP